MCSTKLGGLWVGDVEVPSREELVAEVNTSSGLKVDMTLIESISHPVCKYQPDLKGNLTQ